MISPKGVIGMTKRVKRASLLLVALSSIALSGCGTSNSGGGPVSQPIPQTKSASVQSSGTSTTGSNAPSTSKSSTTGKTSTNNPKGSTAQTSTTALALSSVSVSETGTGNTFVPVSSAVTSILLPSGWQLQTNSLGSGGTSLKLVNPSDPSDMISEVVMPSDRNLQSFYNSQSAGTAHWIVPNQILSYTQSNPVNPYQDRGIMANLSSGGSIRVDVYLPASDQSSAKQILNSFVGRSSTQG